MAIDPVVLFFILGLSAGLMRAEMRLPSAIYEFLSVILLIAIGLKGGIELSKQPFIDLLPDISVVLVMGFILPLLAFPILYYLGRFKKADAASIAGHYGSVSVGTYAVAASYLTSLGITYEAHMPLFLVVLEIPAIIVAIVLVRGISKHTKWGQLSHEIFLGKSIVLLIGGLLIGWIAGEEGIKSISGMFFDPFKGVLALFLLEMGLIAASQVGALKRYGFFLLGFGIIFPIISSVVGISAGLFLDLSIGGAVMLATLAASASYIAVPAAMRIALPESSPTLSLTASLGVTFPFNIILGVPLYHQIATALY
ncbi:MAG: sodium-dependent bicarbonate transport family permease [Proteobacteria bacterium]|nr:sodium-dependent bicarbonate transport family permease [Pseudomonadota bacterium]MCH9712204.1 sodium-dependent bicarbonate transport family permease [Pseudomonadota bacterium]MCH9750204.1 sodium-dependent bicarbonate transport family permease [Pseudomonadota bacterium]